MKRIVAAIALGAVSLAAQDKIRVMVSNSAAWEAGGGFVASGGTAAGGSSGGSRPQTVEIMKTFAEKCKKVQITSDASKPEYVVLFDRQGGKGLITKDSKIAVFERGGDMVIAKSVRTVGGAVQDACEAILARAVAEPGGKPK